jgi:hypothetical protein
MENVKPTIEWVSRKVSEADVKAGINTQEEKDADTKVLRPLIKFGKSLAKPSISSLRSTAKNVEGMGIQEVYVSNTRMLENDCTVAVEAIIEAHKDDIDVTKDEAGNEIKTPVFKIKSKKDGSEINLLVHYNKPTKDSKNRVMKLDTIQVRTLNAA